MRTTSDDKVEKLLRILVFSGDIILESILEIFEVGWWFRWFVLCCFWFFGVFGGLWSFCVGLINSRIVVFVVVFFCSCFFAWSLIFRDSICE